MIHYPRGGSLSHTNGTRSPDNRVKTFCAYKLEWEAWKEFYKTLGQTSMHDPSVLTSMTVQGMSFQVGLSSCQLRSGKGHALGPLLEPRGAHCQKGLACVLFSCQLYDSATHFQSDIFRIQLCVAESLFHGWQCCPSVESSSSVL